MLKGKHVMMLSAIVDKMDIKITDPKASQDEVGADLIMQIIRKAYKAQDEVFDLVAAYKGVSRAEAEDLDFVDVLKEIANNTGIKDFFTLIAR